jgi:hypothetical protein
MLEVCKVPKNWIHPQNAIGNYIPLCKASIFVKVRKAWEEAVKTKPAHLTIEDWFGEPEPVFSTEEYTPNWAPEEMTHFQLYETVTEGTPQSPVMESLEELADWLSVNQDYWKKHNLTKEKWLTMLKRGSSFATNHDKVEETSAGIVTIGGPCFE